MNKLKLFIASSSESLSVAEALNVNFEHECEVSLWTNIFKPSSTALDDLIKKSSAVDFALFVFSPDDITKIREKNERTVRDNVLFEMGIFIGSIGRKRSFLLRPRGEELYLPTDLAGLNTEDYEPNRSDNDLAQATNSACIKIRKEMHQQGPLNRASLSDTNRYQANPSAYVLDEMDYKFLSECAASNTSSPDGISFDIFVGYGVDRRVEFRLPALKLERMGLISKTIETSIEEDINSTYENTYFSYSITELGIDMLLKSSGALKSGFDKDLDDECPF